MAGVAVAAGGVAFGLVGSVAAVVTAAVAVSLGVGGVGAWRLWTWYRLRDAGSDAVRVVGTARPVGDTCDPASGSEEPLLAYESVTERRTCVGLPEGEPQTTWETTDRETDAVPFVVSGADGQTVVDPTDATFTLADRRETRDGRRRERLAGLAAGDEVRVVGRAGHDPGVRADGGQPVDRTLTAPLVVSNHPEESAADTLYWRGVRVVGWAVASAALLAVVGVGLLVTV